MQGRDDSQFSFIPIEIHVTVGQPDRIELSEEKPDSISDQYYTCQVFVGGYYPVGKNITFMADLCKI